MASFALEHLTFTYPGQTRPALADLTLTVPEGAITVLCGESGSGKSTLLRQLKTCLTPYGMVSGTVRLGDVLLQDIPFAEQAQRIGFVLQHPDDQIVTDKVFHELAFGLESLGCDEKTMRLRVAEMASYFGIAGWFDRDVATLSGGQKQMLNLASVVVMRPDVLILDEPTSQLDPIAASTFLHTLRKLNEELGLTILLSEQRLEEAGALADHLIVLEQGRLLAAGAPQETAAAVRGHAIFSAMPTAARISAALGETERLPLTVRAGRAYLKRFSPHPMPEAAPAPVDTPPVLTVRDGWFRYAQGSADVLRNFSLTLHPGELYALTGSNGSGKTTALGVPGRLRLYRGSVPDGKARSSLCATALSPCRRTRAHSSRPTRCAKIWRRWAKMLRGWTRSCGRWRSHRCLTGIRLTSPAASSSVPHWRRCCSCSRACSCLTSRQRAWMARSRQRSAHFCARSVRRARRCAS